MRNIYRCTMLLLLTTLLMACQAADSEIGEGTESFSRPSATEIQIPDPRSALETAMTFINRQYGDSAPETVEEWRVEDISAAEMVGESNFRYTSGSCVATVGYPLVASNATVYQVTIEDDAYGFYWWGEVDASGSVTEIKPYEPQADSSAPDPAVARDQALSFVREQYPELLLDKVMAWSDERQLDGELVGFTEHGYTCGGWQADVAFPIVAPESTVYHVILANETIGFRWSGEVDFEGNVVEKSGPAHDQSGFETWNCYHNTELRYRIRYPADAAVLAQQADEQVTFHGPMMDGEHWPMFSVSHFDNELYHPPEDVDLAEWLADHHIQSDTTGSPFEIAGLPTVHLVVAPTPQSSGFDEYYFVRDGQLYRIALFHTGGRQDWKLYYFILSSFTFEDPLYEEDCNGNWTGTITRNPAGAQNQYVFTTRAGQRFTLGSNDQRIQEQIDLAAWTGVQVSLEAESTEMPGHLLVMALDSVSEPANDVRDLSPFSRPSASSVLPADRLGTYDEWSAVNGLLESPWCEGAAGSGVGQWLQLDFPREVEVIRLAMSNGYDRSEDLYNQNNRVKQVQAIFSDGAEITWELADRRGMQSLVLARASGPNITATWVRLVIDDVYPGSHYDDTCIGEFSVWGFGRGSE